MSLSDQIKQPGQIIGSGGGGGGATTDAGDLTTGQVALARGGTNADLSATGGTGHVLKQSSAGANITVGALTASDIPSTLNATTFAGAVTLSGSISSAGSSVRNIHGGGNGNDWVLNMPSGGVGRWTVSGTSYLEIGRTGNNAINVNLIEAIAQDITITPNIGGGSLRLAGRNGNGDGSGGGGLILRADNDSTYPGAWQSAAPLDTRAASTAFGVCPVATGDVAVVTILNNAAGAQRKATVEVDSAATVTITGDAAYVNSSSPGAAEIGVYISAGVLYCKPGSGFTGKLATFSQIGKA